MGAVDNFRGRSKPAPRRWHCLVFVSFSLLFSSGVSRVGADTRLPQYDLSPAEYQAQYDLLVPQGYRPTAVTAHTTESGPLFQVVWVNDGVTDWASAHDLTWDEYEVFSAAQTQLGRRPLCVSSYIPSNQEYEEHFVSVWAKDGAEPWMQSRFSWLDYQSVFDSFTAEGYRPYWISTTGDLDLYPLFTVLWIVDAHGACEEHHLTDGDFKASLAAHRAVGCRLVTALGYRALAEADPLFSSAWVFWEHPEWESFHGQTRAQLDATTTDLLSQGYVPTFVTAYETFEGTHYTSAWEKVEQPDLWTVEGPHVPELSTFDAIMQQYMTEAGISNGSLAITKDGRLVLARAYTLAPAEWPIVDVTSPFRVASLSKTLTAVGIMKLVETGAIGIDQPISTIIDTSSWVDSRIEDVTVRHLLQHRGGWDVAQSGFSPIYNDLVVAQQQNLPLPTTPQMIVDYMATQPLDYDPGTRFSYSNFGYCLLGRVIEAATAQPYEDWIRLNVLAPVGAFGPHVTHPLLGGQLPGEPPYVDRYQRRVASVMGANTPPIVPIQYGGFNVNTMDSLGGWASSAVDYARFVAAFTDPKNCPLLSESSIALMWDAPPDLPLDALSYYAAGWFINLGLSGEFIASHAGAMIGTEAWFERRHDGVCVVVLFNTGVASHVPQTTSIASLLDAQILSTNEWPTHDLFPVFDSGDLNCDADLTMDDLSAFVLTLLDPAAYEDVYPLCHLNRGDMNGDGEVNGLDIQSFISALQPEP